MVSKKLLKKICIAFASICTVFQQHSINGVFVSQYGFINTCLKSLVIERFGEETWEKLRSVYNTCNV